MYHSAASYKVQGDIYILCIHTYTHIYIHTYRNVVCMNNITVLHIHHMDFSGNIKNIKVNPYVWQYYLPKQAEAMNDCNSVCVASSFVWSHKKQFNHNVRNN